MSAYKALEERFARLASLGHALAILSWDRSVMMPRGSNGGRGDALAAIEVLAHDLLVDPAVGDLLAAAAEDEFENDWQRANLAEMRRAHVRAAAVPGALVGALAKATSQCEMVWRTTRGKGAFAAIEPDLAEVVRLTREVAAAKAAALELDPYDALLDDFQPGLRRAEIDPIFEQLASALPPRLDAILGRQGKPIRPHGPFSIAHQRQLATLLMGRLGFDFERGRLDESAHPFCGGNPDDIRMTTRWDEHDALSGLMGVLHETGHALYEAGLPAAWRFQPVGRSGGMAMHESQSLLVEMQACRTPAFISYLGRLLREAYGHDPGLEDTNLEHIYHHVEPGLIRVDADEVTYPLHIILRYRLEQALVGGTLEVADLPAAWNEGMRELLGIVPPDDTLGCLQDIHWPDGAFGYFPSYSLGALLAAQFFAAAERDLPDLHADLARGVFGDLLSWLRSHVHSRARSVSLERVVVDATGAPVATDAFLTHLDRRYLAAG